VPKSPGNSVFEESGRRELPIKTEEEQALNNEINNGALNTEYENQAAAEPVDNDFSLYTVDYMLQKIDGCHIRPNILSELLVFSNTI
jgi:hypothetical protein